MRVRVPSQLQIGKHTATFTNSSYNLLNCGTKFSVFRLWGSGGTGRHVCPRSICRKACGFDSHLPYLICPVAKLSNKLLRMSFVW